MEATAPLNLKEIRQALGWDQARLAAELGVKQARVSRIERGHQFLTGSQKILVKQFAEKAAKALTSRLRRMEDANDF